MHFLDIETYTNYFLATFKDAASGEFHHFEMYEGKPLDIAGIKKLLKSTTIVTFNGQHYDLPVLTLALCGGKNSQLKRLSDQIIVDGIKTWDLDRFPCDHLDIEQVVPGVSVGLKLYGARINAPVLQDLPIEPDATITPEQRALLREYCQNDVDTTEALYKQIEKDIELREELSKRYGVDLRSKSDPQIAEAIFRKYLSDRGVRVRKRVGDVKPFKYRVPKWLSFESQELNEMLETVKKCVFTVDKSGKPVLAKELGTPIMFGGRSYKFGIGGLHSQEKQQAIIPHDSEIFGEFDIASMYPSIIIEQDLYPQHLGRDFLDIYSEMKEERVRIKHTDPRRAQTFKIVLNGSYGTFGSPYSFLYSPELLVQTTITGQLFLLMAIEKVTACGAQVVSANTDGINVVYKEADRDIVESAIFECEILAGYDFEFTPYAATYSRDVNNYIALTTNNKLKQKGAFAKTGLMKNPENSICSEAVSNYLLTKMPIEEYIRNATDFTKFLTARRVTGGAVFGDEYLGKVVRFYHSTDGATINYKKNGNKVPKSNGCRPAMVLPDRIPGDLDYEWYIKDAKKQLKQLGV